ncbi:MAG: thioredoxin family protein [Campylobacterota bacterium]|nr:thioredoxin family protein [Campylobacterota bacterium]
MKKILLGLALLGGLFFSGALFAEDLNWEKDLNTAFAKAAKEKRPIMVMVEGEHCRWCKKMEHRTLEDDVVSKRLEKYVLVKIDREGKDAKQLPAVKYVPTIFFMSPEKKIRERVTGYFNVLDFKSWIDDAEAAVK